MIKTLPALRVLVWFLAPWTELRGQCHCPTRWDILTPEAGLSNVIQAATAIYFRLLTEYFSITGESSLAVGVSLTATIRVPMADFSSSLGTTTTLTNSLATRYSQPIPLNLRHDNIFPSFTTTYSDVQTSTVTVNIPEGKNCTLPVGLVYVIWVTV